MNSATVNTRAIQRTVYHAVSKIKKVPLASHWDTLAEIRVTVLGLLDQLKSLELTLLVLDFPRGTARGPEITTESKGGPDSRERFGSLLRISDS